MTGRKRHPGITVTGADARTPLEALLRLARVSERVEIGLLYSENGRGRNRYPPREWLEEATALLGERCAVHVCGRPARREALEGREWLARAGRVQLNGSVREEELARAVALYEQVITQHNGRTPDLSALPLEGHALLVDASGGHGRLPEGWERPPTEKPVGFAGGLAPDTLPGELPRIRAVARDPWWVDMEGRLRTGEDWFSLELTERAIEVFLALVSG
jgi:hypothetical protein